MRSLTRQSIFAAEVESFKCKNLRRSSNRRLDMTLVKFSLANGQLVLQLLL